MKKVLAVILSGTLPWAAAVQAEEKVDLQASAYRNSIAQDEVRKQAEEVRQSLALLLQDFYQNQMQTKGATEAQNVAQQLASLTDQQMAPLVQMLKEAGALPQGQEVDGKLAAASQGQKKVQVDLKSLESRLALHINMASAQHRLQQLVLRQTSNLRHTKDLAESGKPVKQLPASLAPLVGLWQSEQSSLKQEIDLALESMNKVVGEVPEAERPGLAQALAESARLGVPALATTASEETALGKFPSALTAQDGLLNGLQAMLAKLKEAQPAGERLQAMKDKLQQLAVSQQQLADAAKKDDVAKRDLREAQAQLADQVQALKKEALGLNAAAALQAEQATPSMEKASDILNSQAKLKESEKNDLVKAQEESAKKLQAASAAVQQQLDKMATQKAPQNAAQAMQALSQLDQQLRKAQAEQQLLDNKPNAEDQNKLAKQTADMQQQALPLSPQAAETLGQAASQMQKNPSKASEALAQASQQVQQQMKDLNQAAAQQAQLQALSNQIDAAKNQANQAGQTLGQKEKTDLNPAIQQMQQAQQTLQQAAQAAGTTEGVQDALKEAQKGLEASILNAAQMKKDAAAASNSQAQKAMDQAKGAVSKAMAQAAAQNSANLPSMAQNTPSTPGQEQQGGSIDGKSGEGGNVQQFMGNAGRGSVGQAQITAGLKPKDRESIAMFKKEKAPIEYQGMVQQYLKNLAEGSAPAGSLE